MRDTDEMKVIHVSGDFIVIDKPRGMLSERPAVGAERKNCPDEIENTSGSTRFAEKCSRCTVLTPQPKA